MIPSRWFVDLASQSGEQGISLNHSECQVKSQFLQCCLFFPFPLPPRMLAVAEGNLGGVGAEGLQEGGGWESTLAELSHAPPTPGAFDGSTVMGLFGSSSRGPGRHPQVTCAR